METLGDKNLLKICYKFYCENCDYRTSKKSSFDDHNLSRKHIKTLIGDKNGDKSDTKSAILLLSEKNIVCEHCNKQYMSRNGLWKHKKKCLGTNIEKKDEEDAPFEEKKDEEHVVEEKKDEDDAPVEEKKDEDEVPVEEKKEEEEHAPVEEKKDEDEAPVEEKKEEEEHAPVEEKKDEDNAPVEEKKEDDAPVE
jgi:hypothetical protein